MIYAVIAFAALFLAIVVADAVQKPKRARAAAEALAKRREEVAARGWQLDVTTTGERSTIYSYSGTTDGVPWVCRMESWTSRSRVGGSNTKVFTRWTSQATKLDHGLLAIWPAFGTEDRGAIDSNVPQFVLNLMLAPLMRALETGPETAAMLASATPVQDEAVAGHYLLRTSDPRLMHRFLDSGAREALVAAAPWLPLRNAQNHLTIAVIDSRGAGILISGWVDDLAVIDRVAAFGAQLCRANERVFDRG